MDLTPLLDAPLPIRLHVVTVVPAFLLGTWLLLASRKGSPRHRLVGRLYLALMTLTSLAAIFITSGVGPSITVGPLRFGWIHLFVPLTLYGVYGAFATLRAGDRLGHRNAMIGVYVGGLLVAGGLTFIPGRLMWRVFFE